jgi:prolipoprotein diacylglyceryltransferase
MDYEILNCYELDVRQEIPEQMTLLKSKNHELNNSNKILSIMLFSVGLGIVLYAISQSSKTKDTNKNKT